MDENFDTASQIINVLLKNYEQQLKAVRLLETLLNTYSAHSVWFSRYTAELPDFKVSPEDERLLGLIRQQIQAALSGALSVEEVDQNFPKSPLIN